MPGFLDLTNKQFGDWIAECYLGNSKWRCRNTKTNEIKDIHSYSLRTQYSDYTKVNKRLPSENLTGQQFGEWTVKAYAGSGRWICECSCDKHTISKVSTTSLKNGESTKCSNPIHRNKYNLVGQHFGKWTVLEYAGDMRWKCKCSCGTEKNVLTRYLLNGSSKSCGCDRNYHIIHKDITGQTFNNLLVLGYTGSDNMWKCKCLACGNDNFIVHRDSIVTGKTKSCGCLKETMRKQTLLERYGDTNTTRINTPRKDWQIQVLESKENFLEYIKTLKTDITIWELAQLLDINESYMAKVIKKFDITEVAVKKYSGVSDLECSLLSFIKTLTTDTIIQHNRTILNGQELDIYIPEKKLAIEFNGTYWHSDIYKDKNYHQQKTINCIKQGIQLIHIFEYEWRDIDICDRIKQYLSHIINRNNSIRVYGRNTVIKNISYDDCKEFLNQYHLQGAINSSIYLGCYHNNELIGVMTFGKPRFNNEYEYELIRLCWKPEYRVIGGTKKLFKYFISNYNPDSIVSYCDITKFKGDVYFNLGFKTNIAYLTEPNYVWVKNNTNDVLTRYQTQKQNLLSYGLDVFGNTEDEIMDNLGYFKVYNSGNMKFIWKK